MSRVLTDTVLCPLARHINPLIVLVNTQKPVASSLYDLRTVD